MRAKRRMWRTKIFPLYKYKDWLALNKALERYLNNCVQKQYLYRVVISEYVILVVWRDKQ